MPPVRDVIFSCDNLGISLLMVGGFRCGIVRLRYAPSLRRGAARGVSGFAPPQRCCGDTPTTRLRISMLRFDRIIASRIDSLTAITTMLRTGLCAASATPAMEFHVELPTEVSHVQFLPLGRALPPRWRRCPQGSRATSQAW